VHASNSENIFRSICRSGGRPNLVLPDVRPLSSDPSTPIYPYPSQPDDFLSTPTVALAAVALSDDLLDPLGSPPIGQLQPLAHPPVSQPVPKRRTPATGPAPPSPFGIAFLASVRSSSARACHHREVALVAPFAFSPSFSTAIIFSEGTSALLSLSLSRRRARPLGRPAAPVEASPRRGMPSQPGPDVVRLSFLLVLCLAALVVIPAVLHHCTTPARRRTQDVCTAAVSSRPLARSAPTADHRPTDQTTHPSSPLARSETPRKQTPRSLSRIPLANDGSQEDVRRLPPSIPTCPVGSARRGALRLQPSVEADGSSIFDRPNPDRSSLLRSTARSQIKQIPESRNKVLPISFGCCRPRTRLTFGYPPTPLARPFQSVTVRLDLLLSSRAEIALLIAFRPSHLALSQFLKRKAGLIKKAWELSVLCSADVCSLQHP
jgi:hypothetical protein